MISVHQLIHTEHIKYILCLTYDAIEEYAPKKERIKGVSIQGFLAIDHRRRLIDFLPHSQHTVSYCEYRRF